jgi:hypothetical protein
MKLDYQFLVRDIFRFGDGRRTVFLGVTDDGPGYISRGPFEILIDGELRCSFPFEGEMIAHTPATPSATASRAFSSTEVQCVDREFLEGHVIVLRPADPSKVKGAFVMHRHLLGIDSPPPAYVPDPMTQGPVLPEGWDGDAWVDPKGRGYYLRAWNKQSGRVAYGKGPSYESARLALRNDVADGTRTVEISTREVSTP